MVFAYTHYGDPGDDCSEITRIVADAWASLRESFLTSRRPFIESMLHDTPTSLERAEITCRASGWQFRKQACLTRIDRVASFDEGSSRSQKALPQACHASAASASILSQSSPGSPYGYTRKTIQSDVNTPHLSTSSLRHTWRGVLVSSLLLLGWQDATRKRAPTTDLNLSLLIKRFAAAEALCVEGTLCTGHLREPQRPTFPQEPSMTDFSDIDWLPEIPGASRTTLKPGSS